MGRKRSKGYELQSALLVSDRDGQPLAPVCQNFRYAEGIYSTRQAEPLAPCVHSEELLQRIDYLQELQLGQPLVHIVDREGDVVEHYRRWEGKHNFLVRAKDRQKVQWQGQDLLLLSVYQQVRQQKAFVFAREVDYQGTRARQYVTETTVTLTRRSRAKRPGCKPRSWAGKPVSLRMIISEVRDSAGKVLAHWMLATNLQDSIDAGQVALWYYWRWRIESFFKLLKGAGHQLEHWQQESALSVAKRLLVVSMACMLVWQLARQDSPEAAEMRKVLIKLSGRQMKRNCQWTAPALLKGVWQLLTMLDLLEDHDVAQLRVLANTFFTLQPPRAHV